jgi:hypothetical protein
MQLLLNITNTPQLCCSILPASSHQVCPHKADHAITRLPGYSTMMAPCRLPPSPQMFTCLSTVRHNRVQCASSRQAMVLLNLMMKHYL